MGFSKFHLSLNVYDLPSTAEFLAVVLGERPTQLHGDYAKFDLDEPALTLSLLLTDVPAAAGLNHLGFRLRDRASLDALEQRLAAAQVGYDREQSVACCHSRQTKIWIVDPAGNPWEFYILEDESARDLQLRAMTPLLAKPIVAVPPSRWGHRLGMPFPDRIPADDNSLDSVSLEGTLNASSEKLSPAVVLGEVARVLRAGGELIFRGITADRRLESAPQLPGPAAAVEYVPCTEELLAQVHAAGFVGQELLTFGEQYCFSHAGAELRETRVRAWLPADREAARDRVVIYRGPFTQIHDDSGVVFRRGESTYVSEQMLIRLQASEVAKQFLFCVQHAGSQCQAQPKTVL